MKEEEARRGGQYIIDKLQASSWIIFRNSKVWQPHCVSIAGQLVQNCTSNYAETYTGINTKFYGGKQMNRIQSPGGTPILGHIRDVRPEWVSFPGRKPANGCKFLTKNLLMGHNFDIILPGNGWFSSKLNKTYCSLGNFYCK